jgi:lysozyme
MHLGLKGKALIKEFEACRLVAYRDQRGIWTCGWGATGPDVSARTRWSQEQADARFDHDVESRVKQLNAYLDDAPTTQNQFDALLSLGYNIGMGALHGSTALRKHIAGDHEGAAKAILMWNKTNGAANKGLTRRRNEEHDLYLED